MPRGLRSTVAAVVLALSLVAASACGDSDSEGSSSGELVLGTQEKPAVLPTFDDIEAVDSGTEPESGTLRIYNYNEYINPDTISAFEKEFDVKIQVTGYDSEDEVTQKLNSGAVKADLVMGITQQSLPRLAAGKLLQPLNPELLPNSTNVATALADPYYDKGAVYTRPYIVYKTGITYRNDFVEPSVVEEKGWDILWDPAYKGYVGLLDDSRETISLALLYAGETDLNTGDQAKLDQAVSDLKDLVAKTNARVDAGIYQKIPDGTFHVAQDWSGDAVNAQYYLPEGTDVSVLGFWSPSVTPVGNDLFAVLAGAEKPALAHAFINFMLDPENAQQNFEYVGYQPATKKPTVQDLIEAELVPENLRNTIVTEKEIKDGLYQYALDTPTQTKWEDAWSTFKAG